MPTALQNCPQCDGASVQTCTAGPRSHWYECADCGHRSPEQDTAEAAAALWNQWAFALHGVAPGIPTLN